jgi:ubiquitin-conjugating enzyme E2 I
VCLSILDSTGWKPSFSVKQVFPFHPYDEKILLGLQELLDSPNPLSPANPGVNKIMMHNKPKYEEMCRAEAKRLTPIE